MKILNSLPEVAGLRVLMYHRFSDKFADSLTVREKDFYEQLLFILDQGYRFIKISDLVIMKNNHSSLKKKVLLTFDDAYLDNKIYALPILQKLNIPATIFLPVEHLGKKNTWDGGSADLMSMQELKTLPPELIEFGLHSWSHENYANLSLPQIDEDLKNCRKALHESGLAFVPALAYPYGDYRHQDQKGLFSILEKNQLKLAFRIGNRINTSLNQPFVINRLDIQGQESFFQFKCKFKWGKII